MFHLKTFVLCDLHLIVVFTLQNCYNKDDGLKFHLGLLNLCDFDFISIKSDALIEYVLASIRDYSFFFHFILYKVFFRFSNILIAFIRAMNLSGVRCNAGVTIQRCSDAVIV